MKLLDNVRMYDHEGVCYPFSFGTETKYHYDGCDKQGGYIRKSQTRPLTTDEQADYLYEKCCKPDSRWENVAELCKAFPELQEQMLCNLNHCNRDKIKSELESLLSFPRHDMTKIKVGDRVRHMGIGKDVTVVAVDNSGDCFQSVENGPWHSRHWVELVKTKLIPFQADKWTPEQKVVTRTKRNPVRILCVDADDDFPVIGLIENSLLESWTINGGIGSDTSEHDDDLMVVVETSTKTLYGFWNESESYGTVYEFESERDEVVEYHEKEHIFKPIKFQTEIEL